MGLYGLVRVLAKCCDGYCVGDFVVDEHRNEIFVRDSGLVVYSMGRFFVDV